MGKKLTALLLTTMLISLLSLPALAAPEDEYTSLETVTVVGTPPEENPAGDMETDGPQSLEEYVQNYQSPTDVDYSGPLDPLTGLPLTNSNVGEDATFVTLKEGVFGYDRDLSCFVNFVGSQSFQSNIPNGAILSEERQTVSITIPSGLSAVLYRNGEALSDADLTNITEAGSYLLEVSASNSSESVSFTFRIIGKLTNAVTEVALPAGFIFESVMLEGEILETDFTNYTQLIEDGAYEISWSCPEISKYYTVSFTRDSEAPTLELPEVTDGQAHSEVTLEDLEADAHIVLENTKTGETKNIVTATTVIKDAGTYHLTVYDEAGNSTSYDFTIHFYLNISALAAVGLILAGILGLWLYSRYIKKHPRVG